MKNVLFLALVGALTGCATSKTMWKVDRASFDLSCPQQQMSSQVLVDARNVAGQPMNGASVGYTGCGKKAAYVFVDGTGWVMNGPVQPQ